MFLLSPSLRRRRDPSLGRSKSKALCMCMSMCIQIYKYITTPSQRAVRAAVLCVLEAVEIRDAQPGPVGWLYEWLMSVNARESRFTWRKKNEASRTNIFFSSIKIKMSNGCYQDSLVDTLRIATKIILAARLLDRICSFGRYQPIIQYIQPTYLSVYL